MTEKSQPERWNQELPSSDGLRRAHGKGGSPLPSVSPKTAVIAQLQRMSPAAIGQLAGPVLELLNLLDTDTGGAEMIGAPIYQRLWDSEGNLRQPFLRLVEWYLTKRPRSSDPLAVAGFVVRSAAIVATLEEALNNAEGK